MTSLVYFNHQSFDRSTSVCPRMLTEADVDLLSDVFLMLQELMEQHEIIDASLKELCDQDDRTQEFTTIENASHQIINSCDKIEKKMNFRKHSSCCQG